MPNYLNKPIASDIQNNYVSQFVPLPLEQFARAQAKQEATQNLYEGAVTQQQDANWKLQGAANEDNNYIKGLRDSFDEVAGQLVNKDLTQKENQDAVKSLVKGVSRDSTLNTILANKSRYDEWQKNKSEMIKANNYQPFNDVGQASYEDYVRSGGYKSGKLITPDIFKYEDSEPVRKQFFDDIQKLGSETIARIGDQWYKNGVDGISEARIGKQAHAAITTYMGTTAAAQDGREYDYMVRNSDPKSLTKDGSLKDAKGKPLTKEKYILDKFLTTGLERAGLSYSTGRAAAMTANAKDKKEDESFSFGTLQTQGQNTLATGGYTFDDSDYDKSGNFTGGGKTLTQAWKDNNNPGSAIMDYFTSKEFNNADPKDQRKSLLQAAAKLNGMSAIDYVNSKAGPDAKITTTFHPIPTKQQKAADNQFYDMQRNTGVFNNMPVMDLTTGKQGSMTEILRQLSDEGQLKNNKGEAIKLSANPTIGEVQQALGQGVGVIGKQDPNHFSPKSYVVGIGGRNIAIDMTYGGTQLHDVDKKDIQKAEYERLKVSPEIDEKNKVIKWYNERTFVGKDGNTYKAGSTYATPLNEINQIR